MLIATNPADKSSSIG